MNINMGWSLVLNKRQKNGFMMQVDEAQRLGLVNKSLLLYLCFKLFC